LFNLLTKKRKMRETFGNYFGAVSTEQESTQAAFIRKTYMHVALAVLGFILVEAVFLNTPPIVDFALSMASGMTWLLVLGGFMFATGYLERWAIRSEDRQQQYLALTLYVIVEAFIFVPLLHIAMRMTNDLSIISQAGTVTLFLFSGLTAVVFLTGKDFSFLRSAITVGGFIALGLVVAGMIFGFTMGLWFSVAMVVLAAGSILYQTSNILNNYHKGQYVAASLALFSSLMLLFWYILSIFMRSE
jgi:FtsH-binding integral membrane protein